MTHPPTNESGRPSEREAGLGHDHGTEATPSRWDTFKKGFREFYIAPYRRAFARAERDEDDLFTMLVLAESLGVPNPATYYTIEVLPLIYERFHDWHRRMGMDRSPLESISCC